MKKFGKILTSVAVIGGAAAGAYALYKKFFAPAETQDDFDEDFEEEFEEDLDESGKRGYVSLTPAQPAAEETEDDGVSAEAIAQKAVAMAEEATEEAKAAAEEAAGEAQEAKEETEETEE